MPVFWLPNEIWSVIFAFTGYRTTLLLVCKAWHTIVQFTPQCWTVWTIRSNYAFLNPPLVRKALLFSGKALPLDIAVYVPRETNNKETVAGLASTFAAHVGHLRSFAINAENEMIATPLLQAVFLEGQNGRRRAGAPILSHLSITLERDSSYADQIPFGCSLSDHMDELLRAVKTTLQSLTLPSFILPILPVNLPSLTSLTIDARATNDISNIDQLLASLHSCSTSLESLHYNALDTFSFSYPEIGILPFRSYRGLDLPLYLPALRSMDATAPGSGTDILRAVHAPNLRRLVLTRRAEKEATEFLDEFAIAWALGALAMRSGPALRVLELNSLHLPLHTWKWLLHGADLPTCDQERNAFPSTQDATGRSHPPFPNLEELVIGDHHFDNLTDELFGLVPGNSADAKLTLRKVTIRRSMVAGHDMVAFCRAHGATELVLDHCTGLRDYSPESDNSAELKEGIRITVYPVSETIAKMRIA